MQIFQEGDIQWRESERVAEKILEKDRQKAREREREMTETMFKKKQQQRDKVIGRIWRDCFGCVASL